MPSRTRAPSGRIDAAEFSAPSVPSSRRCTAFFSVGIIVLRAEPDIA